MDFVSDKIKNISPSIFAGFNQRKKELIAAGVDVIDLGIGAPDLPAPDFVIEKLAEAAKQTANHRYAPFEGSQEFREAVSNFYHNRYDVILDPDTEVQTLIGTKEGIYNMIQAVVNPGENVLIPNPGYPTYHAATQLAGAHAVDLPLDAARDFAPRFDLVDESDADKAKVMLLNYPNNPTAGSVGLDTLKDALQFAKKHQILFASDTAYSDVTFGDYKAPSVMEIPGAKSHAIEFGSLSKSFNMTGFRIGYVVGNPAVLRAIKTLKSNMDSGQFLPIQSAAAYALNEGTDFFIENAAVIESRMETMYQGLKKLGFELAKPKGTIFLWVQTPANYTSADFAKLLMEEAGVIVTPGTAFGTNGEGYFRIALTISAEELEEVLERLEKALNLAR